jgi:hypothetical protein
MADTTNKDQNQKNTATVTRYETVTNYPRSTSAIKRGFQSLYLGPQTSVRESQVEINPQSTGGPPKASAAPTGRSAYLFTGLAEALNTYQNDLVKRKIYSIADVYEFQFEPSSLGACTVKKPGSTDRSKTAGKQASTAKQALDPKADSVNNNSQNWNIQAGTQIVQVIDQIMRSSSLISEQALYQVDPLTQKIIPGKGTGTNVTVWFNTSVTATIIGYDTKRRDFAYKMTFIITPYAITQMASEYFPDSQYRGSHKSYNYWFTGQNTQILNLEQSYDAQYYLTLSGGAPSDGETVPGGAKSDRRDLRDQYARTAMPTTSQKTGQQTGTYTNAAADSASDFYYDSKDFLSLRMRIIGDPAYIFESKVEKGVNGNTFDFRPFNDDGGINFHAQQVVIDVGWNHPQDYDLSTGIMPTADAVAGKAQGHQVYRVKQVRSFFSRGKFEQEIDAAGIIEYNKPAPPAQTRPAAKKPVLPPGGFVGPPTDLSGKKVIVENGAGAAFVGPNGVYRTNPGNGVLKESLSQRVQKENIRRSGLDFG